METGKILLVEDSISQRAFLKSLVSEGGYDVADAENGVKALEYLKEHNTNLPDIVISDIMMPEMDGHELSLMIKKLYPSILIIILTSDTDDDTLIKSFDSGATDYQSKPVKKIELLIRISNLLRIKKAEDTLHLALTKMELLANTDALTGVPNRRHILKELEKAIYTSKRYSLPLSLVEFDIDHFKSVNDHFGHLAGDEVLVKICSFIKQNLRQSDIIGRYGGEEFLIILPNVSIEGAIAVVTKCLDSIKNLSFESAPGRQITFSAGISQYNGQHKLDEFIAIVDSLLYKAKNNGRNRIET